MEASDSYLGNVDVDTDVEISEPICLLLTKLPRDEYGKKKFYLEVIQFNQEMYTYMSKRLPLGNKVLQAFRIYHPCPLEWGNASRQLIDITTLCTSLPFLIKADEFDKMRDQWRAYSLNKDLPSSSGRVDEY